MNLEQLIIETHHGVGVIKLNRPKALNALSMEMVIGIQHILKQWQDDPAILFVYITSTTERAFCSGGDVKSLYEHVIQGDDDYAKAYLKEQYTMDLMIHDYPKPVLTYLHGYVLGGGVGLAMASSIRVTSEDVYYGMPEVHIGFFPDVGASFFLPKFPHHVGTYLAVTGKLINSDDLLYLGVSQYKIQREKFTSIEDIIIHRTWEKDTFERELHQLLSSVHDPTTEGSMIKKSSHIINQFYQANTYQNLHDTLIQDGSKEAKEHMDYLEKLCNASIQITFELFKRAQNRSLRECFKLEYDLAQGVIHTPFFHEGVRKVLIEKTGNPNWGLHDKEVMDLKTFEKLFTNQIRDGKHPLDT